MNQFPASCHNCLSSKREFYVFLQCRHFICLSCSLCMVNLETNSIRCCHRNTKMSKQLVDVVYQQINIKKSRKTPFQTQPQDRAFDFRNYLCQPTKHQQTQNNKSIADNSIFQRTKDQPFQESRVFHTFKLINEENNTKTIKQNSRDVKQTSGKKQKSISSEVKQYNLSRFRNDNFQEPKTLKKPIKLKDFNYEYQKDFESPSFKQIKQDKERKENFDRQRKKNIIRFQNRQGSSKENYHYWKNYGTTEDRILAKLDHHKNKMNSLLKQHYN